MNSTQQSILCDGQVLNACRKHFPPFSTSTLKQTCYVDRIGGQYAVINVVDNLPLPEEPPTDLSHFSHSPPSLCRYNAQRWRQFADGLPNAIEKLEAYQRKQQSEHNDSPPVKLKRQRCC